MTKRRVSKDEYARFNAAKRNAFTKIARALGEGHSITKMMGALAWGRSDAEQGPQSTVLSQAEEFGYLDGYFGALNRWARDHDPKAQRVMLAHYPSGYREDPR